MTASILGQIITRKRVKVRYCERVDNQVSVYVKQCYTYTFSVARTGYLPVKSYVANGGKTRFQKQDRFSQKMRGYREIDL